ncbi:alpha-ketoglutarate dehydrogenase component 4 [Diretmus argenteus]
MGSKVSSKMAAPSARVIQAVRPHAPLIKFPNRVGIPKPNAQDVLRTSAFNLPQQSSPSSPLAAAPTPLSRPPGPVTRIAGTPDTLASVQLLPERYRRRALVVEEMEFIQRGGPE